MSRTTGSVSSLKEPPSLQTPCIVLLKDLSTINENICNYGSLIQIVFCPELMTWDLVRKSVVRVNFTCHLKRIVMENFRIKQLFSGVKLSEKAFSLTKNSGGKILSLFCDNMKRFLGRFFLKETFIFRKKFYWIVLKNIDFFFFFYFWRRRKKTFSRHLFWKTFFHIKKTKTFK